jgi:hypothetical protein
MSPMTGSSSLDLAAELRAPTKFMKELAPRARFELATLRLTAECSAVELPGNRQNF